MSRPVAALSFGALVALVLAGCASNDAPAAGSNVIEVTSTADACELSSAEAPSGTLTFTVTNDGTDVTEFYLLAEDGERVVSELEDIGPGVSRDLVVQVEPGSYVTACKPGMVGDGIRQDFTVTD